MYGGSLAYLTHFETGGKYNRKKIHRYGRFGGGIEDLFLTVLITFYVILRISKNVIIFRTKKGGDLFPSIARVKWSFHPYR